MLVEIAEALGVGVVAEEEPVADDGANEDGNDDVGNSPDEGEGDAARVDLEGVTN